MRFLHTADWHLGKRLNGFDLLADQRAIFEQLEHQALEKQVDAVVIAGDLFDRAIPSEAAVNELKAMLAALNLTDHLPILAISGNHDSAPRLGMASDWYAANGLHLVTSFDQAFDPVTIKDTQFFLLPYFTLQAARNYFHDDSLTDINKVMARVVERMQAQFAPDKQHALVAHFFAAGSARTAESETLIEVGGLSAVAVDLLAPFDYVALGHLHNRNALQAPRVKYAGSPLKLSASERQMEKGSWLVDTAPFKLTWLPLHQSPDLVKYSGSFADLTAPGAGDATNYCLIELTDRGEIPDVMARLRVHYPKILTLSWANHQTTAPQATRLAQIKRQAPLDLLATFFKESQGGQELTDQQRAWAQAALEAVERKDD